MALVRKLVYTKTERELIDEYELFKGNPIVKLYSNFMAYMAVNWERKYRWATCFRNGCMTRGINTNNYAEAGIRILKDIVFKRVKAYNLIQVFDFITMTFEMYYERRLLAVAHNRIDRHISLRYKGLGACKVDDTSIHKSTDDDYTYKVKSQKYDIDYMVDCSKWTCTCTIGRTGHPSGEPCKHQHAVATKYKLHAPNLLPYFNSKGRYMYAVIALGKERSGDESFYAGLMDENPPMTSTECNKESSLGELSDDDGQNNLDIVINLIEDQNDQLKQEVIELGDAFCKDARERIQTMDIQFLTGLKKFFKVYMETVNQSEPTICATPKLSSLLHTYFSKSKSTTNVAGSRHMHVQPTAVSRRREGVTRGNKMATSGRPSKRLRDEVEQTDCNVQYKRGRADHTKSKQNLKLNIMKNQSNHFKHGHGH